MQKNAVLVDGVAHTKDNYPIACGVVQSKNETAHYQYYNYYFKAS